MSNDLNNLSRTSPYNANTHIPMFREQLKMHMNKNDRMRMKSPTNSFIDLLTNQNQMGKPQKKSLSYDKFKQRKIRAIYGKRVSMQINDIEEEDQSKGPDEDKNPQNKRFFLDCFKSSDKINEEF